MRKYNKKITLSQNNRGCYIIDTIKGCGVCLKDKPGGCYDNCYAKNIAARYRFDFPSPVKRCFYYDKHKLYLFKDFYDTAHENKMIAMIKNIDMPFIRIGETGDPSEDWKHTVDVCRIISKAKKRIVIVTKHWKTIPGNLLKDIEKLDLCINTSISALDNTREIKHRMNQFNRLKDYCKSILRIVSCDFNKDNQEGILRAKIQDRLFKNNKIIDTIFRSNHNNRLVTGKVINTQKVKFLKSRVMVSLFNKNTYFGHCKNCLEMCGVNFP